jgi:hypothetical protein
MDQVGKALVHALCRADLMDTNARKLSVDARRTNDGGVRCRLTGGTIYDTSQFLDGLAELLGPVENPRYLLVRRSVLWGILRRADYHAVPTALGRKKEHAEALAEEWRRRVGPADLVYTRGTDGRRLLLKARAQSLAAGFQRLAGRLSVWQ